MLDVAFFVSSIYCHIYSLRATYPNNILGEVGMMINIFSVTTSMLMMGVVPAYGTTRFAALLVRGGILHFL